jgi:hypothetical protein
MATEFPFEEIPAKLKAIIGDPDPGTRIYRAEGGQEEHAKWFKAIHKICTEGMVSPGGAGSFAPVSRAAVYKALREGRLSAFFFHATKTYFTWMGKEFKYRDTPYGYVSVRELKAWNENLQARAQRIEAIEERRALELEIHGTPKDEQGKEIYYYPKDRIKAEKAKAKAKKKGNTK